MLWGDDLEKLVAFDNDNKPTVIQADLEEVVVKGNNVYFKDGSALDVIGNFIVVDNDVPVEEITVDMLIEYKKDLKLVALSAECNSRILDGFEYNGDFFDFSMEAQANFNQQLSFLLMDTEMNTIGWKTENNGTKLFTRAEFIAICKAGEQHKRKHISNYWKIKAHIIQTQFATPEELDAIDLDTVI